MLALNGGLIGPPNIYPRSGMWTPNENCRAKWSGPTVPVFESFGNSSSVTGATTITLNWPTHQTNDIGILIFKTESTWSVPVISGWTQITGSPVTFGNSLLTIYWRRATNSTMPAVTDNTNCDHKLGVIATFKGCNTTGNPWDVVTTGNKTLASNSATVPSLTTTANNTLIVMIVGRPDDNASTTHFGVPVNANLSNLQEHGEFGTISGNGGGFVISSGAKATPGSTGTSTLTKTSSTTDGYMTFALRGVNP